MTKHDPVTNSDKGETILTKGKDGLLDSRYFRRVVDARTDTVLYQAPDDPEAIKKNTSAQRASDLVVHGTYFENLPGIFGSATARTTSENLSASSAEAASP